MNQTGAPSSGCHHIIRPAEKEVEIHTITESYTPMKRTNIVLDEKIVEEAIRFTGLKTQRDVVDFALRELVRRQKVAKLQDLEGNIDWEGDLEQMRVGRDLCEF